MDLALKCIYEIETAIVNSQARTLADAAVQLRRLEAMIEDPACWRLVASVLGVVEGAERVGFSTGTSVGPVD